MDTYVAQTVFVVKTVSNTRVVRVRVGVAAVTVTVVFALPEYAVTGGGVLMMRIQRQHVPFTIPH